MFTFDKRVTVNLIDERSGAAIGVTKIKAEELPASFDLSTTIEWNGSEWQVVKADPVDRKEYARGRKLTLWLRPVEGLDLENVLYTMPTISNELPGTAETTLFTDFSLALHEDDWRQNEFLPVRVLPLVQEEMAAVEEILFPENGREDGFGFPTIHVRSKIGSQHLSISLAEFCDLIGIRAKGSIAMTDHAGFVRNGFAARTDNNVYYGTVEGDNIKELCLQHFESADDEFALLTSRYELLLVQWCKGEITTV